MNSIILISKVFFLSNAKKQLNKKIVFILFFFITFFSYGQQRVLDSLKNRFEKTDNVTEMITIQENIFQNYRSNNLISKGDKYLNSLLKLDKVINNQNLLGLIYKIKGNYFHFKSKPDSARFMYSKALSIIKNKESKLIGDIYLNLGLIMHEESKKDSALYFYKKSLTIYKIINNYRGLTLLSYNMASYFNNIGDYNKSIYYIKKTIEYNKFYKSTYYEALSFYLLGTIQENVGSKQLGLENFKKAIKLTKKDDFLQVAFLMSLGETYSRINEFRKAKMVFEKAIKINDKNNVRTKIYYSIDFINYVHVLINLGEFKKAQKYLDKVFNSSAEYKLEPKKYFFIQQAFMEQAELYLKQGNISKANLEFNKIDKNQVHSELKINYLLFLAKLKKAQKQWESAFTTITEYIAFKDSIKEEKLQRIIIYNNEKFKSSQKEAKILKLSNDNLKKETELIKSKNTIYTISGVLFLTLGLTFFFWYKRKQKQKLALLKNTVQASEEEKKRIGKELHDGIASSIIKLVHEVEDKDIGLSDKLLKTYNEVRDLSHQLNNTPMHGEALLERLIDIIPESKFNQTFTFKITPSHLKINEPYGTHIYRIVQELITNNLKHAKATKTKIQILFNDDLLKIIYIDDGVGITKLKKENGFKNIEDRVTLMKGTIIFNLDQEKGFGLEIEVPYKIN